MRQNKVRTQTQYLTYLLLTVTKQTKAEQNREHMGISGVTKSTDTKRQTQTCIYSAGRQSG